MDTSATHLHREKELDEEAPTGVTYVVRQNAARSNTPHLRGVLRAAILGPLTRIQAEPRVSYSTPRDLL